MGEVLVSRTTLIGLYDKRIDEMKVYFNGSNSVWDDLKGVEEGIIECNESEIESEYDYIKHVVEYIGELKKVPRWKPLSQGYIDFGDNT